MMKQMFGMSVATLALCAMSTGTALAGSLQDVPDSLNDIRSISPRAATVNHVQIANVANAMSESDFGFVSTVVFGRLQINIWTNSLPTSPVPAFLSDKDAQARILGSKAKIAVLIEDTDSAEPYLASPGKWCRVNIRPLKEGNPDKKTLLSRQAKAIMRGISFACGGGATLDGRSATHYSAFTLGGLDKVGITITPDVFFPMLETLRAIGGNELLSPAVGEE